MHSVRIEKAKNFKDDQDRWSVYYGNSLLATFTQEARANQFILSDLCKMLIEHCDDEK